MLPFWSGDEGGEYLSTGLKLGMRHPDGKERRENIVLQWISSLVPCNTRS